MEELEDRRARSATATAGIDFASTQRRTRRLLAARGLTKSLGGRRLVSDLDLVITPGTRVGLIGPNGSGKTTLLNLLAGALAPDAGAIERADGLRVVRFEQERGGLDPAESLRRALAPEGDAVIWQGRSVHVAAWAKRFLFQPEQLERAGGPALGRRAGPHPHRAPDARARRPPDPGRAHQRPRHPHAGSARGQPGGVRRGPGPRHPRPLHARARLHGDPGPRRRRGDGDVRRLRAVGGGAERGRAGGAEGGGRERPSASARGRSASAIASSASGTASSRRSWTRRARSRHASARRRIRRSPPTRRRSSSGTRRWRPPGRRWIDSTTRWAELGAKQEA